MKAIKQTAAVAATAAALSFAGPAAQAGEKELLDVLLQNSVITQQQYDELMAAYVTDSASDVTVSTKGGLTVETKDEQFSFKLGGRLMVDAVASSDDNAAINDMDNGTEFRRARIFMEGTLWEDWAYKWQFDFADDGVSTKDAYIEYMPWGLTIGQFKQYFSLEELTSSKYITFMERSLPNVFATGRRIGLGWMQGEDSWTVGVSLYGQEAGNGDEFEEGYGYGGRITFAPLHSEGNVLHVGVAAAMEQPAENDGGIGAGEDMVRFRSRPEAHIGPRLVDTGAFGNVDMINKYGVEGAWVAGPFSLQGEYVDTEVERDSGFDDVDFDGWYTYASWFLTGESRPYKMGSFGRVKPNKPYGKGGLGAFEVAARYSELDLTDDVIAGGDLETITLGINWYVTSHLRFMANYVMAEADYGGGVEDEPDIFQVRAQLDW
ncbi:MAG: OprO/OprP family phosphate-selective porin [Pseudomonadota bacterium]|nr:OprO/OprP family phosphate-selective porin [Pseudomonadota bacterium]